MQGGGIPFSPIRSNTMLKGGKYKAFLNLMSKIKINEKLVLNLNYLRKKTEAGANCTFCYLDTRRLKKKKKNLSKILGRITGQ